MQEAFGDRHPVGLGRSERRQMAGKNPALTLAFGKLSLALSGGDLGVERDQKTRRGFQVRLAEHIGPHASTLVRDGGTLQTGIGALSDAVAASLKLRHLGNREWREAITAVQCDDTLTARCGGMEPFQTGLYGCSEMLTLGLLDLFQSGIISRRVSTEPERQRELLEAPDTLRADEGIALHGL